MTTPLTQAQAADHLERAFDEAQRLQKVPGQRSMVEKKRLGLLQQAVPKLKRLVKGNAGKDDALSPEELVALAALQPPEAAKK